jgi:hypothetical protein
MRLPFRLTLPFIALIMLAPLARGQTPAPAPAPCPGGACPVPALAPVVHAAHHGHGKCVVYSPQNTVCVPCACEVCRCATVNACNAAVVVVPVCPPIVCQPVHVVYVRPCHWRPGALIRRVFCR